MTQLRVGIIGSGGIARGVHIPNYQKIEGVEVVACADAFEETAKSCAEQFGINQWFTDYNEMLREVKLDIVSVCTPNYLHKDPTIAALNAGVHVMCEKPIAMNAQEGREMVEAAKKSGQKLAMGLMTRQQSDVQALKRAIDCGELGEIYFGKCHALRRRGIPGWGVFGEKDKQGGGPLIDIGVHILDTTLYLMGHPKPVAVSGQTYTKFGTRKDVLGLMGQWNTETFTVEDFAVGLIRFDNGATLEIESSFAANIEHDVMDVKLLGDQGGCSLHPLKIYTEKHRTLYDITPVFLPRASSHEQNIKKFVEAIRNGTEVPVPGEQGLMVTEILDALYRSAEEGREVRLDA
ncbi:MAG: Gfo/Idh/MocA family oxidoreductase [Armatimonadetes bacterium]|nr:Gfo/Idh/MocA family oxidoreductase [Armatimonadota bacterium]